MFRIFWTENKLLMETFKKIIQINIVRPLNYTTRPFRNVARLHSALIKEPVRTSLHYNIYYTVRLYTTLPPHTKIPLPALSPTMDVGAVIKWEKEEGDEVKEGETIAQIETDKAVMGYESPENGFLAKIVLPVGSKNIPCGELLCILVSKKEDVAAFKDFKVSGKAATPAASTPSAVSPSTSVAPSTALPSGDRVFASPMAKQIAKEKNIQLKGSGTGMFGSITSKDIEAGIGIAKEAPAASVPGRPDSAMAKGLVEQQQLRQEAKHGVTPKEPAPSQIAPGAAYVDIPVTGMRATIAKRLLLSKQTIPHYYLATDIVMDKLNALRQNLNTKLKKEGVRLSVNDFLIKAMVIATKKFPEANSSWQDTFIRQFRSVDVCVAVSTDRGLITPIVFNCDSKGLIEINKEVKTLAAKARAGKLKPEEFQGGTITISNLGMYGTQAFFAVINPPQSVIFAIGTTRKRLVADKTNDKGFREISYVTGTGSFDHRTIDGVSGAIWLDYVRDILEDPDMMLL